MQSSREKSVPDGGPSSSRSTRQRGVNSPRVATESPAMPINRDVRASESSELSRRSQGNFFTGPRSAKRETKKNSILPVELQKKPKSGAAKLNEAPAAFEEKSKPTTRSPIRNLKEIVKDKVGKLKSLSTTDFSLPKWFGGKGAELNRRMPNAEWGKDGGAATRNKSVKRHSSVPRDSPPPPPSAALLGSNIKASTAASSPVKQRGRSKLAGGTKAVMSKESEETVEEETPRGRRKTKGSEEIEKEKDEPMSRRESRGQKKKEKEKEATAELSDEDDEMEETALPVERPTKRAARKSRQIPPPPLPPAPVVAAVGRRRSSRGGTAAKEEEAKTKGDAQMVDEARPYSAQSSSAAVDRSMSRKRGRQSSAKAAASADNSQSTDEPPPKRMDTRRALRSTVDREETEAVEEKEKIVVPVTHRSRRRTASEGEDGGEKTEEDPPPSSPLPTRPPSPLPPGLVIPMTLAEALPNLYPSRANEKTTADSSMVKTEVADENEYTVPRIVGYSYVGGQPATQKARDMHKMNAVLYDEFLTDPKLRLKVEWENNPDPKGLTDEPLEHLMDSMEGRAAIGDFLAEQYFKEDDEEVKEERTEEEKKQEWKQFKKDFKLKYISAMDEISPKAAQFVDKDKRQVRVRVKSLRTDFVENVRKGRKMEKRYPVTWDGIKMFVVCPTRAFTRVWPHQKIHKAPKKPASDGKKRRAK